MDTVNAWLYDIEKKQKNKKKRHREKTQGLSKIVLCYWIETIFLNYTQFFLPSIFFGNQDAFT